MNEVMQHDAIDGLMAKVNTVGQPAVWRQVRANIVAIISVFVAFGGLTACTGRAHSLLPSSHSSWLKWAIRPSLPPLP